MASKKERDEYAGEMARRFEEFVQWSIANWPDPNFPLLASDFAQSRKEMGTILGDKLSEGNAAPPALDNGSAQYLDMNPAPWP